MKRKKQKTDKFENFKDVWFFSFRFWFWFRFYEKNNLGFCFGVGSKAYMSNNVGEKEKILQVDIRGYLCQKLLNIFKTLCIIQMPYPWV